MSALRTLVPKPLRAWLQDRYYALVDLTDAFRGRRDPLVPPKRLLRISTDPDSNFLETGNAFVGLMKAVCGLQPTDAVLDIGCGVGRVALPLARFLSPPGRYEGFDIVAAEIEWCATHITPAYPHARFTLADVFNDAYNPGGKTRAAEYRFPYVSESFDHIIVSSVFTHLLARDLAQYIAEAARVLKRGGRCLSSFYLLNERSREAIAAGTSCFNFVHPIETAWVHNPESPEWAVAHDEGLVRETCAAHGLRVEQVFYGEWTHSRSQAQDLVVLQRV